MRKAEPVKKTTKKCPQCGNENLGLFTSLNKKYCSNKTCHIWIDWFLDAGQKKLL